MNASSGGVVVGAAVGIRRRRIVRALRAHNATSRAGAVPFERLGVRRSLVFRRMLRSGVIVELSDGRVFLDEAALDRDRGRRRWMALAAVVAGVLVVTWVLVRTRAKG